MSLEDELRWANSYDAYEFIASGTNELARVLEAPREEYNATRRVPDWAGTDFLRAWLFLLQRIDHWNDGSTAGDEEWQAVVAALAERGEYAVPDVVRPTPVDTPDRTDVEVSLPGAVTILEKFLSDTPLTTRIKELEHQIEGRSLAELSRDANISSLGQDVLGAALTVRRELGRHDDIIHGAVILAMLPHLMEDAGERITVRPSLGAGNDPNVHEWLWESGEVSESDELLPRRLKDPVSRALSGKVRLPALLKEAVLEAFEVDEDTAALLWEPPEAATPAA